MPRLNVLKKVLGFTLIEVLVVIMIGGIISAISIPSFINILDKVNLNNSVAEVRAALQTGQREAIRRSQVCTISLNTQELTITDYCLNGERDLPDRVDVATNLRKDDNFVKIEFGALGSAEFTLIESQCDDDDDSDEDLEKMNSSEEPKIKYIEMNWEKKPNPPDDPSGKIVLYIDKNSSVNNKCIAISNTLGLTRVGKFTGKIKKNRITQNGICTSS